MSSTPMELLELANTTRVVRSQQRAAARGLPPSELIPLLLNPPAEMASYKLGDLFGVYYRGLIPRFGTRKFEALLEYLNIQWPHGRLWHPELRLRELSSRERQLLCSALLAYGPEAWRLAPRQCETPLNHHQELDAGGVG